LGWPIAERSGRAFYIAEVFKWVKNGGKRIRYYVNLLDTLKGQLRIWKHGDLGELLRRLMGRLDESWSRPNVQKIGNEVFGFMIIGFDEPLSLPHNTPERVLMVQCLEFRQGTEIAIFEEIFLVDDPEQMASLVIYSRTEVNQQAREVSVGIEWLSLSGLGKYYLPSDRLRDLISFSFPPN
jgi:hypothetical protein